MADACLMYIDNKYIRKEKIDWKALFCREDVSEKLIPLLSKVPERIAEMHAVLSLREAPDVRPSHRALDHMIVNFGSAAP
jgi:hypothetical protein